MTTLTVLRPGVWLRLPDAVPDSPLASWRLLAAVHGVTALVLSFTDGGRAPFHTSNLHLLETADTNPEEC